MNEMAQAPGVPQEIMRAVDQAFLTAHLLSGSLQESEEAALRAIDSWNPREETAEVLVQKIVAAAARKIGPDAPEPDVSGSYLPDELRAVLRLAPHLRRCFVLRILEGLPAQTCAQFLRLRSEEVQEFTSAALYRLAPA